MSEFEGKWKKCGIWDLIVIKWKFLVMIQFYMIIINIYIVFYMIFKCLFEFWFIETNMKKTRYGYLKEILNI